MKTTGIAVGGQIPGQNLGRNPSFFATVAPNQILALTAWGMSYVGIEKLSGGLSRGNALHSISCSYRRS